MSFAYVQGRELEALAYFEAKLSSTTDLEERKQLQEAVCKLREVVKKNEQALAPLGIYANATVCLG